MTANKVIIEKNWKMEIAGRIWTLPEVRLVRDFRGAQTIPVQDMLQYQLAVANFICAEDQELTWAELELLRSLAKMSAVEVARALRIDKSTVSRWAPNDDSQRATKTIEYAYSIVLKRLVWDRLFGDADNRDQDLQKQRDWYTKQKRLPKVQAA